MPSNCLRLAPLAGPRLEVTLDPAPEGGRKGAARGHRKGRAGGKPVKAGAFAASIR